MHYGDLENDKLYTCCPSCHVELTHFETTQECVEYSVFYDDGQFGDVEPDSHGEMRFCCPGCGSVVLTNDQQTAMEYLNPKI